MRKTYETPTVLVVQFSAAHYIAVSTLSTVDEPIVELTENEYNSEFRVKECHTNSWEDSMW